MKLAMDLHNIRSVAPIRVQLPKIIIFSLGGEQSFFASITTTMNMFSTILFLLLCVLTCNSNNVVQAQQYAGGGGGAPKLESLGKVLLSTLDTSKDQKVSMKEVIGQLATLEQLFQQSGSAEDPSASNEYMDMIKHIQNIAPQIFELLDKNQDETLKADEFKFVTQFHKSLSKGGSFKPLLREIFGLLDTDGNDELSQEEWLGAKNAITAITEKIHAVFPLRETAQALEDALSKLFWGAASELSEMDMTKMAMEFFADLDEDKDGALQRTDIGKAYNRMGKKFLEIAQQIQQFGPMLSMLAGGSAPGGDGTLREF